MNKTNCIGRTALLTVAISALIIASCQKGRNAAGTDNISTEGAVSATARPIGDLSERLKVPEGNKLVGDAFAKGVQIYQVQRSATDPNVFFWINIAPLATLYNKPDFTSQVALHFAGPSWEFTKGPNKGERVVAKRVDGITVDDTAVQWLLLKTDDSLSNAENKITYVQRLFTAGGLAPTSVADEAHLGQLDSIPYTARYFFYEAKH